MTAVVKFAEIDSAENAKSKLREANIHACIAGCKTRGYEVIVAKPEAERATALIEVAG